MAMHLIVIEIFQYLARNKALDQCLSLSINNYSISFREETVLAVRVRAAATIEDAVVMSFVSFW